jgi:hypothetical protein
MKQTGSSATTPIVAVRPRRVFRWLDSLMWLAIAGALTGMLVPAESKQAASKRASQPDPIAATISGGERSLPSGPADDAGQYPTGHEFSVQNEAGFSLPTALPAPAGDSTARERPGEIRNEAPRVTSGATLNGPQLGNPGPR